MLALFITPLFASPRQARAFDSYTKLLIHADGTDASTTFTDVSASAHALTTVGNAQVDTAQSKFGGASLLLDGTGDYLSTPGGSDFAFGTGDFTIDFWVRPNGSLTNRAIMGNRGCGGGNSCYDIQIYGGTNNLEVHTYDNIIFNDTDNTLTASDWNHVAWTRSGSAGRLFINGTLVEEVTDSFNYSDASSSFYVGHDGAGSVSDFNGWIDEVRVSKGIARWTANFTPPTQAYADIDAPTNLVTTSTTAGVNLSWTAPTEDGDSNLQTYGVWRSTASFSATTSATLITSFATSTGTTYSDTSAVRGTNYYYSVTATNASATSSLSNQKLSTTNSGRVIRLGGLLRAS